MFTYADFHSQPNDKSYQQTLEIIKSFSFTKVVRTNQEANVNYKSLTVQKHLKQNNPATV